MPEKVMTLVPSISKKNDLANDMVNRFIDTYQNDKKAFHVNFRTLIDCPSFPERATHLIHSYPAKLLPHIPHFLLSNSIISKANDTIADPFCGSGTVLLESILHGRSAIGADSNPLARLISRVKTTPIPLASIEKAIAKLRRRIPLVQLSPVPDVVNLRYWFYPHVIKQLRQIKAAIAEISEEAERTFFLVCFSACIKHVSLADPRLSVPVRLTTQRYNEGHWLFEKAKERLSALRIIDSISVFFQIIDINKQRMQNFYLSANEESVSAPKISADARSMSKTVPSESVQLIITSPPYAGAQKYIRSSSLNLGWLDMCPSNNLRMYENLNIGREHYAKKDYLTPVTVGIKEADSLLKTIRSISPLRAHIAGNYLLEMKAAFTEAVRLIKPNGFLALIVGNNKVCNHEFLTQSYLTSLLEELGMEVLFKVIDDIKSRGLMTKRNKTAGIISCEWVILFQKIR